MKPIAISRASIGILSASFCFLSPVVARAGHVHTRDGKSYDGVVHFSSGNELTVTLEDKSTVSIPLATVADADFTQAPPVVGATAPAAGAASNLPSPWQGTDLGDVHLPGSEQFDSASGTFRLSASGWGILGSEDSLHLVYQPFHGDGQIIAHLVTPMGPLKNPPAADKQSDNPTATDLIPGITFRQSVEAGSPHASVMVWLLNSDVKFKFRPGADAMSLGSGFAAIGDNGNDPNALPRPWLRLTRRGNLFSGYSSSDGKFWNFIGEKNVDMPQDLLAGLAVSSANNILVGTVAFDHVSIVPGEFGRTYFPGSTFPESGIVLRDGSVIAGTVLSVARPPATQPSDPQSPLMVAFQEASQPPADGTPPQTLAATDVAALLFKTAQPALAADLQTANVSHGISLTSGDQMEGELEGFVGNQITINSVVLGVRRFDAATDAIDVILNPTTGPVLTSVDASLTPASGWIVKTKNGSRFYTASLTHSDHAIAVKPAGMTEINIPDDVLIEVKQAAK